MSSNDIMVSSRLLRMVIYSAMLITLLACFSGCISIKNLPASKISSMPEGKRVFFFHTADTVRIVYPVTGNNSEFTAIIVSRENIPYSRLREVHIYAGPPSVVRIEGDKLMCPMENIARVENYRLNAGTIIIAAGVLLLLFTIPIYL